MPPRPRSLPRATLLLVLALALAACGGDSDAPAEPPATGEPAAAVASETDPSALDDTGSGGSDFAALRDDVTRRYFELVPEMATYYGVPENISGAELSGKLSDYGPDAQAVRRDGFRQIIADLEAVDRELLSDRDRVVHDVFLTQFRSSMAPAEVVDYGMVFADYGVWYLPYAVTQLSGPQVAIPGLLEKQHGIRNEADAHAYIERLAGYGEAIDQVIATIDRDRERGVVPPSFIIDKAIGVVADRSSANPEQHSLVTTLAGKLADAGLDSEGEFMRRAEQLVRDVVLPANERLTARLEALDEAAGDDAGIWRLPKGEALYAAMIRHMTDTDLTPRAIHDIGLAEVERIVGEMDAILSAQGMSAGSVGGRMAGLARQKRFLYPNTDQGKSRLVDDLNAQMAEIRELMPQWFGTIPDYEVVVRAVPSYAEASATGGFYDAPALDGSRPGTYWINLRDTAIWPSWSLKTLTYHEADPGHHHQTAIGMGLDAPILQSVLYSNAFGEGWGLYAELLAKEMGLYADDPWGDLGRLQAELHRAVRLVVDTGIHALRWSREDAIRYMIETEGTHPSEAEAEIDRYVTWPGQALGYKIGMLRIVELRERARAELGKAFDIRAFHDEVLNDGGIPLQVLDRKIETWIAAPRGGAG